MSRAYTVDNVLQKKFIELEFEGKWEDACGKPEKGGQTWFIYGDSKMGKTSFAMQFGKMLTAFGRVAYDSIEEGFCKRIRNAYVRAELKQVKKRFLLFDREEIPELIERLQKRNSPDFVFIDSIQFAEMTFNDYKRLKWQFPNKNFIYISHVIGKKPDGAVAMKIFRDASMSFRVEGFKAFPTSRYGGNQKAIVINQELAEAYWGLHEL